jgi:hypothetical protein
MERCASNWATDEADCGYKRALYIGSIGSRLSRSRKGLILVPDVGVDRIAKDASGSHTSHSSQAWLVVSFKRVFYSAVKSFDNLVTSAVTSRRKYFRNTVEHTNFCHELIEKLRAFIGYELIWNAMSGENEFLHDRNNSRGIFVWNWYTFRPTRERIDKDNGAFAA